MCSEHRDLTLHQFEWGFKVRVEWRETLHEKGEGCEGSRRGDAESRNREAMRRKVPLHNSKFTLIFVNFELG